MSNRDSTAPPQAHFSSAITNMETRAKYFWREQRYVNVACYANTWWVFARIVGSVSPKLPHLQHFFTDLFSVKARKGECWRPVWLQKWLCETERQTHQGTKDGQEEMRGSSSSRVGLLESVIRPDIECCLRVSHRLGLKGGVKTESHFQAPLI